MADIDPRLEWQSEDEIRTELFTEAQSKLPKVTNYNSGGVFRTFLEIVAKAKFKFMELLSNVLKQTNPKTATGKWLDVWAGAVGLTRHAATKVQGTVYFTRESSSGNVVIPVGTIVSTSIDNKGNRYRFMTISEVVLADGTQEVAASVTAEFAGAAYNVGTTTIVQIQSAIAGVDGVENRTGWIVSEGTDEETDEQLRERYFLRWDELAQGSTKRAYIGYAKRVNGVIDVEVDDSFPRGPGTVDIYITGAAGLPTQSLIDEVQSEIEDNKPIASDALVKAPTAVSLDPTIYIYMYPGVGTDGVQTTAESVINALFIKSAEYEDLEDLRIKIGWDPTQDAFIAALRKRISGIKYVDCGFDVVSVAISELAVLGTLTVTVEEAAAY